MFTKIISYLLRKRIGLANFFIKRFLITTEDLVHTKSKYKKVINKEPDRQFAINPTEREEVNECFSKWIGKHSIRGDFLVLLENAYIVSNWAIPVTEDGNIILETSGRFSQLVGNLVSRSEDVWLAEYRLIFFLLVIKISKFFNVDLLSKKTITPSLFHMVPRHGFNYNDGPTFSHWVFENLPQVRIYHKALTYDSTIKLFVGKIRKDWQVLTLSLLGIKKKQIYEFNQTFFTKIKKLYICRLPYIHSSEVEFDPEGRSWVNKTIRSSLSKNDYIKKFLKNNELSKVAFSRKYCSRRRLLNEDKYLNLLCSKGYKIIYPEKISELEKIAHSYYAKAILGLPSGSAIANLIFSSKPNLIEIQDKKSLIPVWFILSQELKLNYRLHFANFTDDKSDFRENNLVIDPKEFPNDL